MTPASTARRASSTRHTPLSMNGPPPAAPTARASTPRPPRRAAAWSSTRSRRRRTSAPRRRAGPGSGAVRSGMPACANCARPPRPQQHLRRHPDHRLQVDLLRDLRAPPVATHRERPVQRGDQPHRARLLGALPSAGSSCRGRRSSTSGRTSAGWPATTSSTDLEAKLDSPITVPRAAAARATATSPSGCTACTPVGEMITGSEMSWPITRGRHRPLAPGARPRAGRSRSRGTPPRCPRSSARAPSPPPARRTPARAAACCARRCATATDSNHGFCFHGFANQLGFGMPLILCVRPRRGHLSGRTGSGGRMDGSAGGCGGAS